MQKPDGRHLRQGKSGTPHFYYICKGKRLEHSCDKAAIQRDLIEQTIAEALKSTMLTDKAILALADAIMDYQDKSSSNAEVEALRHRLAEIKQSINNLVAAIEAGIFSSATQSRLADLEAEQKQLAGQLSIAQEDNSQQLTRDQIIAMLKLYQDGNIADKAYQEALIDTFLVAAYVYDNDLKIIFNLGGAKKEVALTFDVDDIDLSEDVCISSPEGHQNPECESVWDFCL